MKPVAVVICNYNKKEFVLNNLKSVFASDFTDFDVIVVDNASTDGSVDAIREQYGERLTLLVNEENTGGSGGFNCGMNYAAGSGYKYIHLLDNDVVVDKDAIGALFEFMEMYIEAGACGSLILKANQNNVIQEYGANIGDNFFDIELLFRDKTVSERLPESITCDYVAACSAIYRADVLSEVGLIDKDYFLYWDDLDLSWKIRSAGYSVCAYSKSVVRHYGSFLNRTSFSRYYSFRNKIHCLVKHLDDEDFSKLCDMLTERLLRMLAVNRINPEYIETYLHALDDALNNVRGKAVEYKIVNPANERKMPAGDNVINVPHVLDVSGYDRTKIYTDVYQNILSGNGDFDFVQNIDDYGQIFNQFVSAFIKTKLTALRKEIR